MKPMKLAVFIMAALLPLTACVFVPDHRNDGPHDDHWRQAHCDHDGHCDHQ